MISEATKLKAKFRLGIVDETKLSKDRNKRSVTVRYVLVSDKDNVTVVRVQRLVQRCHSSFQWKKSLVVLWLINEHLQWDSKLQG